MNNPDPTQIISNWWNKLKSYQGKELPARGTVAGALVVLEHLKENYDLDLDSHRAKGKSQIRGISGSAVNQILQRFGEHRRFLSEGGRTNRGLAGDMSLLLDSLKSLRLEFLSSEERNITLNEIQAFLVGKVKEYFNQERLKVEYNPSRTVWDSINALLKEAHSKNKSGPVAEYLIGAKLALRFPEVYVENKSFSTADALAERPGDFFIGDTAFHVTVHPTQDHYHRCLENLRQGIRPFLLVLDEYLAATRQNAKLISPGQISVESIESFVSQNLDELSAFSKEKLIKGYLQLLQLYNKRVDEIENDKSYLIDIPNNILRSD